MGVLDARNYQLLCIHKSVLKKAVVTWEKVGLINELKPKGSKKKIMLINSEIIHWNPRNFKNY